MRHILSRVIVVLVFSETTLSAEVAVCDVYRPVHIGLVLAHPTVVVRAFERRLLRAIPNFTARMALLRGIARVHRLDGNPHLDGLVPYRI